MYKTANIYWQYCGRFSKRCMKICLTGLSLIFLFVHSLIAQPSLQFSVKPNLSVKWIVEGAKEEAKRKVCYDESYVVIDYPGGDLPANKGVCTDFVIRSFRKAGIDLQKEVFEHMQYFYDLYSKPSAQKLDSNVEHRRIKNLMVYFKHNSMVVPISKKTQDYQPGDIVVWKIKKNLHIGIIVDLKSRKDPKRYLVAHHSIKKGPQIQDILFAWKIIGHYRYY